MRTTACGLLLFMMSILPLHARASGDYRLNWSPSVAGEWAQVLPLVQRYQAATPKSARLKIEGASKASLLKGISTSFAQNIQTEPGGAEKSASVELARIFIPLSYERFTELFPASEWGVSLDHYLGGEVEIYERDSAGRPVKQLERMVLSLLPGDLDIWIKNQDMTKLEVISYRQRSTTVTWWVRYSDNHSTESDLGTVDFRASGDGTLVTFHSAHRIRVLGGPIMPSCLVKPLLESFFLDHLRHYRDQVL